MMPATSSKDRFAVRYNGSFNDKAGKDFKTPKRASKLNKNIYKALMAFLMLFNYFFNYSSFAAGRKK